MSDSYKEQNNFLDFLNILYKRLYILIICVVIFTSLGLAYGLIKDKPIYTAKKTVMIVANIADTSSSDGPSINAKLAKMLLEIVTVHISSPTFIGSANDIYENSEGGYNYREYGNISSKNVTVDYNTKSLIFTIAYSDFSMAGASTKLDAVIKSTNQNLEGNVMAKDPKLTEMQNAATITKTSDLVKIIFIALAAGLIVGVAIELIINACDNTIKTKEDLESITGETFLCFITNQEELKSR